MATTSIPCSNFFHICKSWLLSYIMIGNGILLVPLICCALGHRKALYSSSLREVWFLRMQRKKQEKVKKGFLVVWVGCEHEDDEMRRFTIPISYLYHPQFRMLLEKAREVYGFRLPGPLKLPCSVDDFLHLQWLAGRETTDKNYHVRHKHLSNSLSFRSC